MTILLSALLVIPVVLAGSPINKVDLKVLYVYGTRVQTYNYNSTEKQHVGLVQLSYSENRGDVMATSQLLTMYSKESFV